MSNRLLRHHEVLRMVVTAAQLAAADDKVASMVAVQLGLTFEDWRDVPGEPGFQASSWGRVRVLPYTQTMPNGGTRIREVQPTFGFPDDEGRPKVKVRRKTYRVCDLVCRAFHGAKKRREHLVMHLDEDNRNNTPGNLAWGTNSENQKAPKLAAYKSDLAKARPRTPCGRRWAKV